LRGNWLLRSLRVTPPARDAGAGGAAGAPGAPAGGADEPPPILGRWGVLYAIVIAGLVLMIALCAAITRWAS
jgi:hypothetical protein